MQITSVGGFPHWLRGDSKRKLILQETEKH